MVIITASVLLKMLDYVVYIHFTLNNLLLLKQLHFLHQFNRIKSYHHYLITSKRLIINLLNLFLVDFFTLNQELFLNRVSFLIPVIRSSLMFFLSEHKERRTESLHDTDPRTPPKTKYKRDHDTETWNNKQPVTSEIFPRLKKKKKKKAYCTRYLIKMTHVS